MKGRSYLSALLSVHDKLIQNLSSNQSSCIDTIYLDFAKAFDKVDHGVLLHTFKNWVSLGIWGNGSSTFSRTGNILYVSQEV